MRWVYTSGGSDLADRPGSSPCGSLLWCEVDVGDVRCDNHRNFAVWFGVLGAGYGHLRGGIVAGMDIARG